MANIRTLGDYRAGPPPPPTSAGRSTAAGSSGYQTGSRFGSLADFRSSSSPAGPPQQQGFGEVGFAYEPARSGVSFARSPDVAPGDTPTCRQQCCPRMGWRYLTTVIALVNTIILIIELIVGSAIYGCAFDRDNQMGGPSTAALFCFGGKWQHDIRNGAVWRLITPIFLHAGLLHLAGNMFLLLRLGYVLEVRWGWWRFGLVYLLTGISASLWSCVIDYNTVSVGASGAIMGILGADVAYLIYNYHEIPDVKMEAVFLVIVIVMNFLFGLSQTGIDNAAHLGGLLSGLPLGIAMVPHVEKRENEKIFRIVAGTVFGGLFLLFCMLLFVGDPGGRYAFFACGQSEYHHC